MGEKGIIVKEPMIPVSWSLPSPPTAGTEISVKGVPIGTSGRFSINLCKGPDLVPNCALHVNPRFDQNCIVFNTMKNNKWGKEERTPNYFLSGKTFEVIITVQDGEFLVDVKHGGVRHTYQYNHRVPKSEVGFIHIKGDVTIQEIVVLPNA